VTPSRRAILVLMAANVAWGSTFFLTKRSVEALDAGWASWLALRFGVGALAALLIFLPALGALRSVALWRDALWIALPTAAGFALQTAGLKAVSPATSAFLTSLYVPFTPLAAWILFRSRPPKTLAVALVLALGGLWLVTAPQGLEGLGQGELLSAACGAAFAVQIVLIGRLSPRHDPRALSAALGILLTLAFLLPALLASGGELPFVHMLEDPWAWGPILYMGAGVNLFTFWAMTRFQPRLEASHAAVIYALEPVLASLFSAVWAGERFGTAALAGAALVVAANLWAGRAQITPEG